jgi:hypothetical protein
MDRANSLSEWHTSTSAGRDLFEQQPPKGEFEREDFAATNGSRNWRSAMDRLEEYTFFILNAAA